MSAYGMERGLGPVPAAEDGAVTSESEPLCHGPLGFCGAKPLAAARAVRPQ